MNKLILLGVLLASVISFAGCGNKHHPVTFTAPSGRSTTLSVK